MIPAYHLNKTHWNSIILDGTILEEEVKRMIGESYDLTAPVLRKPESQFKNQKENGTGYERK